MRDLVAPAAGDGLKLHFELHFGSRVEYDPASGHWLPLENDLAVQEDLPVLQRMKACLFQVLPWPPSVEVVHAVAAQCGVRPVKRRIRLQRGSARPTFSTHDLTSART